MLTEQILYCRNTSAVSNVLPNTPCWCYSFTISFGSNIAIWPIVFIRTRKNCVRVGACVACDHKSTQYTIVLMGCLWRLVNVPTTKQYWTDEHAERRAMSFVSIRPTRREGRLLRVKDPSDLTQHWITLT